MKLNFKEQFNVSHKIVRGKINQKKLSVSIPYKQRLENIAVVLEALAHQTMHKDDFEVIIGAMDYCENLISLCNKYINKINIITVLSPDNFMIPWARNLAMRQATGQVIVQMDADTLLPPNALQNLYDTHFAFEQRICVVGQVIGYENNNEGFIESVQVKPYENYQDAIMDLENSTGKPKDPRFQVRHVIPWAFGWTGFIALPLEVVRELDLYFDETFQGWGVDDLEWSYRICKNKIPIILSEKVRAIHLPHARDPEENRKTETLNYRRFLMKWPSPDVELAHCFGDVEANSLYLDFMEDRRKVMSYLKGHLGIARGFVNGKDTLIVGLELNEANEILDSQRTKQFDTHAAIEIYPLIGMALPFSDKEIEECKVLNSIPKFSDKYASAVYKEVDRVSKNVVLIYNLNPEFNLRNTAGIST
ncbi:MAG: glycosyltransferase [Candidatus Paracaedibacteraceae bacterium]|nr:glycosyltransferase [Candidatus Paracaedibacteraceae bacterium]